MSFKSWAGAAVERRLRPMIRGEAAHRISPIVDVERIGLRVRTIFDVGTEVGSTSISFTTAFPEARIECFEPVGDTSRRPGIPHACTTRMPCSHGSP